jgi:hypothetical protein
MSAPLSADLAQIGKSVVIKGELSGSEDLYVDGQVEGSIALKNHSLTVGTERFGEGHGGCQGDCGAGQARGQRAGQRPRRTAQVGCGNRRHCHAADFD